jgi:thymidylate synthase (FAD)
MEKSTNLFDYIPTKEIIEEFNDTLWIYAVAARICYFKKSNNPKDVLDDPKVNNPEVGKKYLINLAKKFHTSIFAHTIRYFVLPNNDDALYLAAKRFKITYPSSSTIGITFRHVVEDALKLGILDELIGKMRFGKPQIINEIDNVIYLDYNPYFDKSYTFVVGNISRVTTHQLVRHTMLNFNQRSDRYVENTHNKTIIPPSMYTKPFAETIFKFANRVSRISYYALRKLGIPKEDARYIIPEGNETLIMVSGDQPAFKHMLENRLDPHAQWEIRDMAQKMVMLVPDLLPKDN